MGNGLLKDSIVFASSRYILLGFSLIRNFFVAKLLGPSDYGLWIIIGLILTYADQIHLGLRHAGDKEIPYFRGQGKAIESSRIANEIFGGVLSLSSLALLCLVVYAFFFTDLDHPALQYGVFLSAFIIVSDQVNRFYLMILRTRHEFLISSKVEIAFELLRTILVSTLVVIFHFLGAMIGLFIASLATAVYFLSTYKNEFSPQFGFRSTMSLLSLGFPLSATGLLYIFLLSLDRVIGAISFSKEDLGVYGMAGLIAQLPVTSSQGISSVIYPRISEQFGEGGHREQLKPLFEPAITGAAFIVPLLVATLFFVGRFLILWFLPAFRNSIDLLFLLSFGSFFLCLVPVPAALLMAAGRNVLYLRSEVFTLLTVGSLYFLLLLKRPFSTSVLAGIASFSFFLLATLLLDHAFSTLGIVRTERLKEIFKLYLPSVSTGIALAIIIYFLPLNLLNGVYQYFWQMLASLGLYYLLYSPVLYVYNRKTGMITRVLHSLWTRGGKVL